MIALPFIYFIFLGVYFYKRNRQWGIDLAATSLLVVISFCAIMIEINNIYDDYGINRKSYNIFTLLLFCIQWTVAILPLHIISRKEFMPLGKVKRVSLYLLCVMMLAFSSILIQNSMEDIKMALIMDAVDVRTEHYNSLNEGVSKGSNYFMLLPQLCTNTPFPTIALVIWFYMYSFIKGKHLIKTCIILASVVQAVLSIIIAGRAAMVYWIFDFYLAYSLFYKYLNKSVKRAITTVAIAIFSIMISAMMVITFSRFDGETAGRDPFDSIYGYAGQHINNFSIMFVEGWNTPLSLDRVFPFISKTFFHKQYDMNDHYLLISSHAKVVPNVFDTFGAEVFLDLGIVAYVLLLTGLVGIAYLFNKYWDKMYFYRVLLFGIYVAFVSHGIFAWPFTGHYTTMSMLLLLFFSFFFKFRFKI